MWKKAQALVPTWTAFAVVKLMEQHFDELVDYDFTARVETDLDAIAAGDRQKDQWLQSFYFGDDALPGLKKLVEENLDEIDAAAINTFPSAPTLTAMRSSSSPASTDPTSSAATTPQACPRISRPTS